MAYIPTNGRSSGGSSGGARSSGGSSGGGTRGGTSVVYQESAPVGSGGNGLLYAVGFIFLFIVILFKK